MRAGVALMLFVVLTLAAGPARASAHAALERSLPAAGADLSTPPAQVELYFGEHLVQNHTGTFAVVYDDAGRPVSGDGRIDPQDGKHFTVPLQGPLGSGTYVVFWKTTSDDDGGVTLGSFTFSVGAAGTSATQQGPVGGQVLVPDDQQGRALTLVSRAGGQQTNVTAIVVAAVTGLVAGSVLTYAALRFNSRRGENAVVAASRGRRR